MTVALLSPNGMAKKLSLLARLAIVALVVIARRALLAPRLGRAPLGTFGHVLTRLPRAAHCNKRRASCELAGRMALHE